MTREHEDTAIGPRAATSAVRLPALVRAMRPHQWVKNVLVFGGLVFSRSLVEPRAIADSLLAFAAFCAASSATYLLNDLRDANEDRLHPQKRFRPIASGELGAATALAAIGLLYATALGFSLLLPRSFIAVLAAYVAANVAYSMGLKRLVLLDVLLLSSGFVLRAIGGALAISVEASPWLVLCTLLLALLVGFGKRRQELRLLSDDAAAHRVALEEYSVHFLEQTMSICAGAAIVSYALYTLADETVARFGTPGLVLTVPFVVYGIFRYLLLSFRRDDGGDPAHLFLTDRPTVVNAALWVLTVCAIVYGPREWLPW